MLISKLASWTVFSKFINLSSDLFCPLQNFPTPPEIQSHTQNSLGGLAIFWHTNQYTTHHHDLEKNISKELTTKPSSQGWQFSLHPHRSSPRPRQVHKSWRCWLRLSPIPSISQVSSDASSVPRLSSSSSEHISSPPCSSATLSTPLKSCWFGATAQQCSSLNKAVWPQRRLWGWPGNLWSL